ncbi:unnamed protein product, partial [Brassica oleracea var. botrytis]
ILALQEDFDRLIGVRNIRPMQGMRNLPQFRVTFATDCS